MKKLLIIAVLVAGSFAGMAQKDLKFSIGVDAGVPVSDYSKIYSFAIGGSVEADYKVAPELALTLNAGYLNFNGKTNNGIKFPSTGSVPVLAGIKYYFGETQKVYGSAQLGVAFSTEKNGGSSFTYAPGVGYKFTENFDALLKYTGYSTKGGGNGGLVGIRLAYSF